MVLGLIYAYDPVHVLGNCFRITFSFISLNGVSIEDSMQDLPVRDLRNEGSR